MGGSEGLLAGGLEGGIRVCVWGGGAEGVQGDRDRP